MREYQSPADAPPPHRSGSDKFAAANALLITLITWYISGALLAVGFAFGIDFIRPASGPNSANRDWLDRFNGMDGRWYRQIVVDGYHYDGTARSNVAFFPLFPLLARTAIAITGVRAEAALVGVSNLSFLAALAILALYVRERFPSAQPELTDYTLLTVSIFPTSCFFRFAYSESTFLLLALLAMYAMLRRWPLWCIALLAGLTTAARPVGVALVAPFVIHVLFRCRNAREYRPSGTNGPHRLKERHDAPHGEADQTGSPRKPWRVAFAVALRKVAALIYLPITCFGLIAFMGYQCYQFSDALAFFKVQERWKTRDTVPWPQKATALATLEPIRAVYDNRSGAYWRRLDKHDVPWLSLQFANPILFLVAAGLIIFGAWHGWLSPEETSMSALLLLIPYVTRAYEMGMGSGGRFAVVVFPAHLVLARLLLRLPRALRGVAMAYAAFLFVVYTALYAAGYAIF
jgi:hypothetical protein